MESANKHFQRRKKVFVPKDQNILYNRRRLHERFLSLKRKLQHNKSFLLCVLFLQKSFMTNCSSQLSMFHWLSSPISPCPSVCPAMVTSFPSSSPLPSSSSPPPSPSLDAPRFPCHPGPLKCFCAPRHQISAKSAP